MNYQSTEYAIAKLQARMDAEALLQAREDELKCRPGNKPCGKRCIPQEQKCSSETAKGALAGARAGTLGLLGPVGTVANAAIGAKKGGKGNRVKGAVKEVARGLATPLGGAVYGGLRARGYSRGKSAAAAIGTNVAAGLGAYAAYSALRKKEDSNLVDREDSPKCKAGNKPCGGRCIPFRHECKAESGGAKGGDALHKTNADFLYKHYGFEDASRQMAKNNPRMSLNTARQYHKEMAYSMAKNIDGDPNKDIGKINKKYQSYFGK